MSDERLENLIQSYCLPHHNQITAWLPAATSWITFSQDCFLLLPFRGVPEPQGMCICSTYLIWEHLDLYNSKKKSTLDSNLPDTLRPKRLRTWVVVSPTHNKTHQNIIIENLGSKSFENVISQSAGWPVTQTHAHCSHWVPHPFFPSTKTLRFVHSWCLLSKQMLYLPTQSSDIKWKVYSFFFIVVILLLVFVAKNFTAARKKYYRSQFFLNCAPERSRNHSQLLRWQPGQH